MRNFEPRAFHIVMTFHEMVVVRNLIEDAGLSGSLVDLHTDLVHRIRVAKGETNGRE